MNQKIVPVVVIAVTVIAKIVNVDVLASATININNNDMDAERNLIWESYQQVNENIPLQSQQGLDLHKQLKPLIYAVRTYRDAGVRDDNAVSVHVNDLLKQGVPHENIKHVLSQAYSEEDIAGFLNPQH